MKMKRSILTVLISLVCSFTFAQREMICFMGIPVDGSESEMVKKLKKKGFKTNSLDRNSLIGEFNGAKVSVRIATNNNKVYRIVLNDQTLRDGNEIRTRFNQLVSQFNNNPKYMSGTQKDYIIPMDEDVSYNISVKNKRYEAIYCQIPEDLAAIKAKAEATTNTYIPEGLVNISEETRQGIIEETYILYLEKVLSKRIVWFTINEFSGKYFISMFYDNEYNRANGEDL